MSSEAKPAIAAIASLCTIVALLFAGNVVRNLCAMIYESPNVWIVFFALTIFGTWSFFKDWLVNNGDILDSSQPLLQQMVWGSVVVGALLAVPYWAFPIVFALAIYLSEDSHALTAFFGGVVIVAANVALPILGAFAVVELIKKIVIEAIIRWTNYGR